MTKSVAYSAKAIASLKEPGQYKVTGVDNLWLFVGKGGGAVWKWRGRIGGVSTTESLGPTSAFPMAQAGDWAMNITVERAKGRNIIAEQEAAEEKAAVEETRTCDWLWDLYMQREGSLRRSGEEKQRVYNRDIKPAIGSKSIYQVTRTDLSAIVDAKVVKAPIMANALVALIKRWWRWSVTTGYGETQLEVDPAANLVKPSAPVARKRYFNDQEIEWFLRACRETETSFADPWLLILYTAARREEAFGARWDEIDLSTGVWTIPGSRTKNKEELVLPLAPSTVAMLTGLHERRIKGVQFVWPSGASLTQDSDEERARSGFSKAVKIVHNQMVEYARKDHKTVDPWSTHDLRRTVATGMNGLMDDQSRPLINSDIVERITNHKIAGVKGVYNRWAYFAEKKQALALWADHIDAIRLRSLIS